VPRQPERQVDIEVIAAIPGVSRGDVGKWTPKSVDDEDQDFYQNDAHKPRCLSEPARIAEDRNRQDAKSENQPNGCVKQLD